MTGYLEYRDDEGNFHRVDGPARIMPNGRQEWWWHGKRHREGAPAVISEGLETWWRDGVRHRDDGPACIYPNGSLEWYKDGYLHRVDGPAISYSDDGITRWWLFGREVDFDVVAYLEDMGFADADIEAKEAVLKMRVCG